MGARLGIDVRPEWELYRVFQGQTFPPDVARSSTGRCPPIKQTENRISAHRRQELFFHVGMKQRASCLPGGQGSRKGGSWTHTTNIQLSHGLEGLGLPSDSEKRPKTVKSSIFIRALIRSPSTARKYPHQPQDTDVFASPNTRDPGTQPGHPPHSHTLMLTYTPTRSRGPGCRPGKGITEGNKTDISALATALETFGDFKRGTTWNIGKEGAMQLIAITRLLHEASLLHGPDRLATNNGLKKGCLRHQSSGCIQPQPPYGIGKQVLCCCCEMEYGYPLQPSHDTKTQNDG